MDAWTHVFAAPGQPPQWVRPDRWAVGPGRWIADRRVARERKQPRDRVNGWATPPAVLGDYRTHCDLRAVVAKVGLGANHPADAPCPNTRVDSEGRPLHGDDRCRLHVAPGTRPKLRVFWSVTAYGADDFPIAHPLGRHARGESEPLLFNADRSLDLWVQADEPPAERRANGLPLKAGALFLLDARLYWPKPEIPDGRRHMPAVPRQR
jgi:hypothetical protein